MTTRREFLSHSGSALGGVWLARLAPLVAAAQACASDAMREGLPFSTFTPREGADFDALAARIVPSDDTPGAREAGSVYFADHALGTFLSDLLPIVREGLSGVHARAGDAAPGEVFADLPEARQDDIVSAIETEDPQFFFFLRTLVMLGLVSNPEYGGNRDGVGWALLGFEPAYQYEPPFGYYDRDEHAESTAAAQGSDAGEVA